MTEIQFTRHAKNGMRSLRLSQAEVIDIIRDPDAETSTEKGRTNAWRRSDGIWIRVPYIIEDGVVVVISVHERKRGPQ